MPTHNDRQRQEISAAADFFPDTAGLWGGDPIVFDEDVNIDVSTAIDIFDESGTKSLGYITSLNWTSNRPVTPVRVLSSMLAGRILFHVPSPETNTLTVTGYSLYTPDESQPLQLYHQMYTRGVASGKPGSYYTNTIGGQFRPFCIREQSTHPYPPSGGVMVAKQYYQRAMLTNFTKPRNIGTAIQADTASIAVQYVDTVFEK